MGCVADWWAMQILGSAGARPGGGAAAPRTPAYPVSRPLQAVPPYQASQLCPNRLPGLRSEGSVDAPDAGFLRGHT